MLLLQHGAKVDAATTDASTALHKAAWQGHAHLVMILLAHGADQALKDSFELTPLDKAKSELKPTVDKQPIVELLTIPE
jgi:ankyrin repeat protein